MKSISVIALLLVSSAEGIRMTTPDGYQVYPLEYHFNEDYHSVPDPLSGKPYMTSTQARLMRGGQTQLSVEPAW